MNDAIPVLRELLSAHPFKAFDIVLKDGRKLPVRTSMNLTISRRSTRIWWEEDSPMEIVDMKAEQIDRIELDDKPW